MTNFCEFAYTLSRIRTTRLELTNRTSGDYVDLDLPIQLSGGLLESPFAGVLHENAVLEGFAPLPLSHNRSQRVIDHRTFEFP
jgi:hypothetical protein